MTVSVDDIKALRAETGAGVMACRTALSEADGDLEQARALLRERGVATAAKRAHRDTAEGIVESYLHRGRIGAMLELNCETDFVARTDVFKELAHDIAMQIASMNPQVIDAADLPADADGDPAELALLSQTFIKDPSKTIQDLITDAVATTGEKIAVRRFARYELGGEA
ncbi:MAG: elongation factor Ts [Chloroflexi bacterium]|nr:elongation factor Ts [Chloroflexota bacterium]